MSKSTAAGRAFATYALSIGAIELLPNGRKLKSGRVSPYFFNSGLFNTGQAIASLGAGYAGVIMEADPEVGLGPEVLYGPAYKGISLVVATSMVLSGEHSSYQDLGWAFNRKEPKDHGEGGLIVGTPLASKRVLILDDVTTNGDSKREAIKIIVAEGGIPVGCVVAFDRQERGDNLSDPRSAMEILQAEIGIPMLAAATLEDLIQVLEEGPDFPGASETLPLIIAYRDQYGA